MLPVTGTTPHMRHGNQDTIVRAYVIDQLVRESLDDQPSRLASLSARNVGTDFGVQFDERSSFSYRRNEFRAETRAVVFVPPSRGRELRARLLGSTKRPGYRLRISCSTPCSTSPQDTSFARPASTASIRRSTSAAHAASTSWSGSPSKLAINWAAISARSRVSKVSASDSTFSAGLVTAASYADRAALTRRWSRPPRGWAGRTRATVGGGGSTPR